jgi:Family of unknown function (DUF5677)
MNLILRWIYKLGNWIAHIKPSVQPPHPSKMSAEQITADLASLLAAPYSRENQRRVALLMGFDSDLIFGAQPGEDTFEQVVALTMQVSLLIAGEKTTIRHSYASYMLYRICTVATSVTELYLRHEREPLTTLDYSSIAVLCRTIIDASIMYWYLTEEITDDEWNFRLAVLNVHDSASRVRLFKGIDPNEAETQRANLVAKKNALSDLALFNARTEEEKAKLLSGQTMYVNGMRSLLKSMNVGKVYFDGLYNYLSAHVHLAPLSYFRLRQGSAEEVTFARGFMQLCLYEASRMVVRVALREITISALTEKIDSALIAQMKEFEADPVGTE